MTPINHLLAEVDQAWTSAVTIVWDSVLDHQLKLTIIGALERGRIAQLDQLQREVEARRQASTIIEKLHL